VVFSPLDKRWGLDGSVYSESLRQQMVWVSGLLPYQQAEQVFERIAHRVIRHSTIWRQTDVAGERMKRQLEQRQAQVVPHRLALTGADHHQQKGVSMDGWKLHIRDEGWKECKAGTVYDVVHCRVLDAHTGEMEEQACATHIGYTAVVGEVGQFAPALWALAVACQVPQASRSSITADGAEWIWNLASQYFPDSVQIVDWYHADEHLAKAAQAMYAGDEARAGQWRKTRQTSLYTGQAWKISQELQDVGLPDHAHYFEQHKRRMQYQTFQEEGYPIGSGTVESACKQYKVRFSGPGMRWSRSGAERLLVIRSAILSDQFDQLWRAA
jgi:hypothetical protein